MEAAGLFAKPANENLVGVSHAWVLSAIYRVDRSYPWEVATSLPEIAGAMSWASIQDPIFSTGDGARRTAAVLVSLAHHASGFKKSQVRQESEHRSCGLYAVRPIRGVTSSLLMLPRSASLVAIDLIRTSLEECRNLPVSDRLARYQMRGLEPEDADVRTSRSILREAAWLLETT
jgi:hypothetical protein